MRRLVLPLVFAVAGTGLGSGAARAQSRCATVFDVCPEMTLVESGSGWALRTHYASSASGALPFAALDYGSWDDAPGMGIGHEIGRRVHGSAGRGLQRPGRQSPEAFGETTEELNGELGSGRKVIAETFPMHGTSATAGERSHERDHGAGAGNGPTSGTEGGVGSPGTGGSPVSATTTEPESTATPEPASMLLLAAGLGGLAVPAMRRRRRKQSEA